MNISQFKHSYHILCAFELDEVLREVVRECPGADKASHMVAYGFIDPKEGLMFELLGVGKQGPKYFYFRDPYQGKRVSLHAADLPGEFLYFSPSQKSNYKKYSALIERINADNKYPDDVEVLLLKDGLKKEKVWVRITGVDYNCITGKLLNEPYQIFGISKGDIISFSVRYSNHQAEFYIDFNVSNKKQSAKDDSPTVYTGEDPIITEDVLKDGTMLKQYMKDVRVCNDNNLFWFLITILRSCRVVVPNEYKFDDKALKIINSIAPNEEISDKQWDEIMAGAIFYPVELKNDKGQFFLSVFSSIGEIGNNLTDTQWIEMPFIDVLDVAMKKGADYEGIVINAFSDKFLIEKKLFDEIKGTKPFFKVNKDHVLVNVPKVPEPKANVAPIDPRNGINGVSIIVGKMDLFNYALYHNDFEPIHGIKIINETGSPIDKAKLRITSDVNIFKTYEALLPPLSSGAPISLNDPHIYVNGNELAALNETINANITIELIVEDKQIAAIDRKMKILAYDQWQGSLSYLELLPAFVQPNNPIISTLMQDVSNNLKSHGKSGSLEGYQCNDVERINDFARAAYEVIKARDITYANPPASFMVQGQRIRTPEVVLDQKLGTCMDMTILYASLLESIGLHPILVLLKDHIFAGYWNRRRSVDELNAGQAIIEDPSILSKLITGGANEISLVECTCMCSDNNESFEQAKEIAQGELLDANDRFDCSMDIYMLRDGVYRILPIPSRLKVGDGFKVSSESVKQEDTPALDGYESLFKDSSKDKVHKITNKKDLWESKLLDLTSRNMLLNLPKTSAVLPIMSSNIGKLEDALSDGEEFSILPIPEWIFQFGFSKDDDKGKQSKPILWIEHKLKENGIFEIANWPSVNGFDCGDKILQEYRKHRLYSFYDQKLLDRDLTSIYRAARKSQQENGVSSMFIAIGLLRWIDEDAKQPHYAPLILVPVELVRKPAGLGYALHMRNEDPHFNSTLIEILKQNYNLDLSALNTLPADEHGISVNKTISSVRNAVFSIKGWNVIETCVLGNFSFAQFAMWNDIHSAGDSLDNNKLVRSLIKGYVDWDIDDSIDDDKKVYLPITVDATQLRAIKMSAQGKTFVLHGPPGTGKSQTITAMIANLMANGKRVLFVAEKKAALEVVKNRLNDLGLDDFCLEIHSDKADKKHVLTELETALNKSMSNYVSDYSDYEANAASKRQKLDVYANHLHEVHTCGYSLRMLIALYELVRNEDQFIRFNPSDVNLLTPSDINAHVPLIEDLIATGASLGDIDATKLLSIRLTFFTSEVRSQLRRLPAKYESAIIRAKEAGLKSSLILGTEPPKTMADLYAIDSLISLFNVNKDADNKLMDLLDAASEELLSFLTVNDRLQTQEISLMKVWHPEFLRMNMRDFLNRHEAAAKKIFGKQSAMSAITEEIQSYSYIDLKYEQIPVLLTDVMNYQANKEMVADRFGALSDKAKELYKEIPTVDSYSRAKAVAEECQKKASEFPGGLAAIMDISQNAENSAVFNELEQSIKELEECRANFDELLVRKTDDSGDDWFDNEIALCEYLMDDPSILKNWGVYNKARQECFRVGLAPVVAAYENGMDPRILIGSYKKGLYYALINNIISNDDELSSFSGVAFNEAIAQFKKIDDELLSKTKQEIARVISSRIPSPTESAEVGKEISILRKAISNNAWGISLRELFARIPNILFRLCPCMLMSPNSVAQYLPQDNGLFDVVIFDEASQLPTCKAIGSLLRAKDAVIVGDPKQMPPTSFFAGAGPEVEDFTIADLDSVLEDVLALGVPSQHLQWHYRSRHESLIAFSNYSFYKNRMFTFPSANDRERRVVALHVDGKYKKGTNAIEAEEVVAEIVRRFNDPVLREQSIGVVTFNMSQQELIENLLMKQYQKDPDLDRWANSDKISLFVKNLENVQGDERDAIIFSICYGPDEKGKISNNFGPINKVGGEKRLNVAFSRARMSMTIITSMSSSDIHVGEDSPEGVKAFHRFLKYAEGSDLVADSDKNNAASYAKAGIMQRICQELKLQGYECVTMIGHSDFHLDIAVVDPFDPSRYLLGILLDGDGYGQTKNTRDREVGQIGVLKSLGWNLCRVWAMDWWDNRDKEIDKLLKRLDRLKSESEARYLERKLEEEKLKEERERKEQKLSDLKTELENEVEEVITENEEYEQQAPEPVAEPIVELIETSKPDSEKANVSNNVEAQPVEVPTDYVLIDYEKVEPIDNPISIETFSDSKFKKDVAEQIHNIVNVEAPILKESLMRRVFEVYGVSKSTNSTEAFEKAFKFAKVKTVKLKGSVFCWADEQDPDAYRYIRSNSDRSCEEICMQEISNALCYVLIHEGPMSSADLIKKASMLFGYKRLGKNVEASLLTGLRWAKSKGLVEVNGGVYSISVCSVEP